MTPERYSIYAIAISFVVLMAYYIFQKPDFVMETPASAGSPDEAGVVNPVVSIRLSIIYALLFSSTVGLFVLGISTVTEKSAAASPTA